MPKISLVVCLRREYALLSRLLEQIDGNFDDLLVIHDGSEVDDQESPASEGVVPGIDFADLLQSPPPPEGFSYKSTSTSPSARLVQQWGGRFFEGPRCLQQEPHWPFAWLYSKYDWILRFDTDEFPSSQLFEWLNEFRQAPEPSATVAGFNCVWPLWDGRKALGSKWPDNRVFLFNRRRVRVLGLAEQVPTSDDKFLDVPLVLHHQPQRKSFGIRNLVLRRQAYVWRRLIADSLVKDVAALPRWRWNSRHWPPAWEDLRKRPLTTGLRRFLSMPLPTARLLIRHHLYGCLYCSPFAGLHHLLIAWTVFLRIKRRDLEVQDRGNGSSETIGSKAK